MPDGGASLTTRFKPGPDTTRTLRDALGCFATGVTVITARAQTGPLGITANSFASVSLDPALVLWSPAKASRRYEAFVGAEHFAIHVLAEDQDRLGGAFVKNGDDFEGFDVETSAHGVPLLAGCLARFECRRFATHDAGDHAIIIGEVIEAETRPGAPLLFARGQYGRFTGAE